MKSVHVLLILIALPVVGSSAVINVPGDYPTIQSAIDAALSGDTILVASGTYVENIDFLGKAVTVQSTDGATRTVIDGAQSGSVVTFEGGEGPDSALKGFTITNGKGEIFQFETGGGITCRKGTYPTIVNNIITGNDSKKAGGGIFCIGASPMIAFNDIMDNEGGGIECSDASSPLIENNRIMENRARRGAGIRIYSSSPTIRNNVISGNHTKSSMARGGGIFAGYSLSIIANNIISGNTVESSMHLAEGGGLSAIESHLMLVNNTIAGNKSTDYGGGMHFFPSCDVIVKNTILWDNEAPVGKEIFCSENTYPPYTVKLSISYSVVEGGLDSVAIGHSNILNWGPIVLTIDPQFVDSAEGDYHLTAMSLLRDKGYSPSVHDVIDFEGDPRIAGDDVDIGADEFHPHLYYTGNATPGGEVYAKFIGTPGISPVALFIGYGILESPVTTPYGTWYLAPPWLGPFGMPSIPPNGVLVVPATLPATPAGPYDIPMQAFIGDVLSNLSVVKVR